MKNRDNFVLDRHHIYSKTVTEKKLQKMLSILVPIQYYHYTVYIYKQMSKEEACNISRLLSIHKDTKQLANLKITSLSWKF